MPEKAEQLELTGLGYVEMSWVDQEGRPHKVRWRRPTLREYRELRNLLHERSRASQDLRDELTALLEPMNQYELAVARGETATRPDDPDWLEVDRVRDEMADFMLPWVQEADRRLADGEHLPEDQGDWPTWLSNGAMPAEIVSHWRTVPKAPGSKGTNSQES